MKECRTCFFSCKDTVVNCSVCDGITFQDLVDDDEPCACTIASEEYHRRKDEGESTK